MNKNLRNSLLTVICSFCLTLGQTSMAQNVIFPQAKQAGIATLAKKQGTYTLKNNLLTAKFIQKGDKLLFGGCKEMNLQPGTELFKVFWGMARLSMPQT